jgi:dTDP-4-dehydrorhamnose 3,5-epimerase
VATVVGSAVIEGVVIVDPKVFSDARGMFVETYRREWIPGSAPMVQANRADRQAGCLVGLHYHLHQADYWYIVQGTARVVLHDLRQGSPTDGATVSFEMGDSLECGVYIPPGVGHGFAALTDVTLTYLVDQYYSPEDELGVAWDDPDIAADWGLTDPILSRRDQTNPLRADIPTGRRPLLGSPPPPIPDPALEV